MARYLITFDNGTTSTLEAETVVYNYDESILLFKDGSEKTTAWVPSINVHSVTQQYAQAVTD